MNEREELAMILVNAQRARYSLPPRTTTDHCSPSCWAEVDAILAAGYRKPRTITTAEELDALPVNAVIRGKWLAEKWGSPEGDMWFIAGRNMEWFTDDIVMRGGLPATVLYEPEPQS